MTTKKTKGISFSVGGGLRWVHESRFCDELQMSPKAFRRFCRVLGVPMLHLHSDWLVNIHMFRIGLWAACRFGQPDFLVPGCSQISKGKKPRKHQACSLPLKYIEDNLSMLVEEVNKVRVMDGVELEQRAIDESRDAARRMLNLLNPRI